MKYREVAYVLGLIVLFVVLHEAGHYAVWLILNQELVMFGILPVFNVSLLGVQMVAPMTVAQTLPVTAGGLLFVFPMCIFSKRWTWLHWSLWIGFLLYGLIEVCTVLL